jgi:MFS family permease
MAEQGLGKNWKQFTLLVIINAFVGGMVGIERSIFPEFAENVFGIASSTAIISFIAAFGLSKSIANYFAGKWANLVGRRNLLVYGWIIALPVPFILIYTADWTQVIGANILLGISQGLTWSSTVVMKIDLVGQKDRGFAMGINEFAGYLAVGIFAFISASVADNYGLLPYPFYLGIALSVIGLFLSVSFVRDTRHHVIAETKLDKRESSSNIFWLTTWKNPRLNAITQAGMVNNMNDGMIWGLLPILLASYTYSTTDTGWIAGTYPLVWGLGQLFTGKMGDHFSKKSLLFWGMLLQGIAILSIPFFQDFGILLGISIILGLGTALVYPNFLSAVADSTTPNDRAESIGTFRLWRDLGYVFGALLSGVIADFFGIQGAIMVLGGLTLLSAAIIQFRWNA